MFDYLQKFNSLPADLRAKVSSDDAMNYLSALEHRYRVDLAMVVMKVMIKSLAISDLESNLVSDLGLTREMASNLSAELKEKIFSPVADYLGLKLNSKEEDIKKDIELLIKEAGIMLPSSDLLERLKKVLNTYLKGVRQKIDTRQVLAKDISSGGIGLSHEEVDRIFKLCDLRHKNLAGPKTKDGKIDTSALFNISPEYDLKRALQSGETKKIAGAPKTAMLATPNIKAISPAKPSPVNTIYEKVDIDDLEKQLQVPSEDEIVKQEGLAFEGKDDKGVQVEELDRVEKEGEEIVLDEAIKEDASEKVSVDPSYKKDEQGEQDDIGDKKSEVISDDNVFIIKKPEKTNLFKKLFSENNKKQGKSLAKTDNTVKTPIAFQNEIKSDVNNLSQAETSDKKQFLDNTKIKEAPQKDLPPIVRNERAVKKGHKRLDDVKFVPKVMGPLEELQYLDVLNFRRLGTSPQERTTKIFNKVKLLEKEGYGKMIEAITAWKKSPVNRLYLRNVQLAISKGDAVKEFVDNNREGGNNLSFEEIEAIIGLNSRLTF